MKTCFAVVVETEAPLPREYAELLCEEWRRAGVVPEGAEVRVMSGPEGAEVGAMIEGTEAGDVRNEVAEVVVLAPDVETFVQVVDAIRARARAVQEQSKAATV